MNRKGMMPYEDKILETVVTIQNDSTLMLIGGVAISVLLAVVLVIVVSAMRIKIYKNRFLNVQVENKEKSEHITKIEKELEGYRINSAKIKEELAQFSETKSTLKSANESYLVMQSSFTEVKKELVQLKAKLEALEGMHTSLTSEHKELQEKTDVLLDENSKYRSNNARLLMKLETEERHTQNINMQRSTKDKNG